jgi:predicted metal-dependent phosphoesterase TrpH
MSGFIDLHMHTWHSDGVYGPARLLDTVREKQLAAFSVTDHDTLEGYHEIKKLLQDSDPELIPGVELSVEFDSQDMHLLAYCFDPDNNALVSAIEDFQEKRNQRGRMMVEKLRGMGLNMDFEAVEKTANGPAIGRPHVAEAMFNEGLVETYEEAFYKYIGNGRPAYVPKVRFLPVDAFKLVHEAGGVVVMAHPMIGAMHRHIEELSGMGLDGIEIYHCRHEKHHVKRLRHLAERFGLVATGGSDFHGRDEREAEIGSLNVPAELSEKLKIRGQQIRGSN